MATVDKNFKVKHGLVVEGTTATVNGEDVITTGSSTDSLPEGSTNKYYSTTQAKSDAADLLTAATLTNITITGDENGLTITAENGVADSDTDDLTEGTTNLYFTNQRAIDAVSSEIGSQVTAAIDALTTDDIEEGSTNKYYSNTLVDNHLTGGSGITYSSGDISVDLTSGGGLGVALPAGTLEIKRSTVDTWYDAAGAASTVAGDLDTHISDTSTHGVTGDIVGTTDAQVLTNKTINDELYFTNPSTVANDGGIKINDVSEDMEITAYTANLHLTGQSDVTITSNNGDIVLNPDGAAYITSVSAGNQIATNSYVDNAVSGLSWKEAVNLKVTTNIANLNDAAGTYDGHPVDSADIGYRLLLTGQSTATENGIYVVDAVAGDVVLSRSTDADAVAELIGAAVFVMEGDTYGGTSWVQSNHYADSFDDLSWTQFSGSGSVTAGTGIAVDGLEVSIDRTTVDTWYDEAGATSTHSALTTGVHGVTGNVVGTTDTQTLTNKTANGLDLTGTTEFKDGDNNSYLTVLKSDSKTQLQSGGDLRVYSSGDVVLDAVGDSYVGSATAGNEIATKSYVDTEIGNIPDAYITSVGTDPNLSVTSGVLAMSLTPEFTSVEVNSLAKHVAATTTSLGSVTVTAYSFDKAVYKTAKFLVKIDNGTENEVSEVLLTLDSSYNIAITEYAIVSTNGSRGTITADIDGLTGAVRLRVNPVNDSTINVVGTLLA